MKDNVLGEDVKKTNVRKERQKNDNIPDTTLLGLPNINHLTVQKSKPLIELASSDITLWELKVIDC